MTARSLIFVDQYADIGGGQRVLTHVARAVFRAGAQHVRNVVFAIPTGGELERELRAEGGENASVISIPEFRVPSGRQSLADLVRWLVYSLRVTRRLWAVPSDNALIHANGSRVFLAAAVLSRMRRIPAVYHLHLAPRSMDRWFVRWLLRTTRTRAVVCASPFIQRTLGATVRDPRIVVVENALPEESASRAWIDRFADAGARRAAVCAGLIAPHKGQDRLVALARACPDLDIHCIGRIPEESAAWAAALRDRAPFNLKVYGHHEPLAAFIEAHGVQFALVPSRRESFGLAAIESMANSCIAIVSGAEGLSDVAARTGALVARTDEEMLEVMQTLLCEGPAQLAERSRAQHHATLRAFAPSHFAQQMLALLTTPVHTAVP